VALGSMRTHLKTEICLISYVYKKSLLQAKPSFLWSRCPSLLSKLIILNKVNCWNDALLSVLQMCVKIL
jgi:hypothetical protein